MAFKRPIHFDLHVTFRDRQSYLDTIQWFVSEEIDWPFTAYYDADVWTIEVNDMPWANNLERLAEFLKTVDAEI